jgi:cyanophycinase-like exopeptidase
MGRLVAFDARIMKDVDSKPPSLIRGIGIDEHTALLLDPTTGNVNIVGVSTAYICVADHAATVCSSGKPLTFQGEFIWLFMQYNLKSCFFDQ